MRIIATVIFGIVGLSIFFYSDLDLNIARYFYSDNLGFDENITPWKYISKFGVYLPCISAIAALIAFIASYWINNLKPYRIKSLFIILAMLIGPIIITNVAFKSHYARPRPRQVKEFGGDSKFVKALNVSDSKSDRRLSNLPGIRGTIDNFVNGNVHDSFPSGHTSLAFFMMFIYFIFISSKYKYLYLALGFNYGIIIG